VLGRVYARNPSIVLDFGRSKALPDEITLAVNAAFRSAETTWLSPCMGTCLKDFIDDVSSSKTRAVRLLGFQPHGLPRMQLPSGESRRPTFGWGAVTVLLVGALLTIIGIVIILHASSDFIMGRRRGARRRRRARHP